MDSAETHNVCVCVCVCVCESGQVVNQERKLEVIFSKICLFFESKAGYICII